MFSSHNLFIFLSLYFCSKDTGSWEGDRMRAAAAGSKVQNRKSTRGERGGVEKSN
jgi:hypothetical protein